MGDVKRPVVIKGDRIVTATAQVAKVVKGPPKVVNVGKGKRAMDLELFEREPEPYFELFERDPEPEFELFEREPEPDFELFEREPEPDFELFGRAPKVGATGKGKIP